MCKKVTVKNSHQFFKHGLKLNVTKCCCYFQREPLYKRHPIAQHHDVGETNTFGHYERSQ